MFNHIIRETPEGMASKVARAIQQKIMENNAKGIPTVLGLATGSTPELLYKELVRLHQKEGLDFSSVITFNLDEYWGLAPDNPQSYNYYMHQHLFNHVNIKKENIHMLDGTVSPDLIEEHVKAYEKMIEAVGGIDIQIFGVGLDGHIAFNEIGSEFTSRTRLVKLADNTLEANKRFFKSKEEVPTHAITMGIGTILQFCKECYLLASGSKKAAIIADIYKADSFLEKIPATALYHHNAVTWILDEAAASMLPTSVQYKTSPLVSRSIYATNKNKDSEVFPAVGYQFGVL